MGALIGSTGTSFPFHPRSALRRCGKPCLSGMQTAEGAVKVDCDQSTTVRGTPVSLSAWIILYHVCLGVMRPISCGLY